MSVRVRAVLFVYCIVAVVVLLSLCVWVFYLSQVEGKQLTGLKERVLDAETQVNIRHRMWSDLASEQREHRADYGGQEAIVSSIAVQKAEDEYLDATREMNELKKQLDERTAAAERRILLLVPLIALGLLHIVGGVAFRPRRG